MNSKDKSELLTLIGLSFFVIVFFAMLFTAVWTDNKEETLRFEACVAVGNSWQYDNDVDEYECLKA